MNLIRSFFRAGWSLVCVLFLAAPLAANADIKMRFELSTNNSAETGAATATTLQTQTVEDEYGAYARIWIEFSNQTDESKNFGGSLVATYSPPEMARGIALVETYGIDDVEFSGVLKSELLVHGQKVLWIKPGSTITLNAPIQVTIAAKTSVIHEYSFAMRTTEF
jgi:hypothetical protein